MSICYIIAPEESPREKKQLFESVSDIFSQVQVRESQSQQGKIVRLENRIKDKDQLISELVEENIALKKSLHGVI